MQTLHIKKLNPKEVFPTQDDLRNWVFENTDQLEEAIQIKLAHTRYNPDAPYIVRPDICTEESQTSYRIAVMMNLEKITEKDFFRYLTIASLNDVKKIVWIVANFDKLSHCILEWLNDRTNGNVEFIVLKLSTYEMPNEKIATKLERLEKPQVPIDYEKLI